MIHIRAEQPADHPAITALLDRAFKGDAESCLVGRLRRLPDHFIPGLALVAEEKGIIAGYIVFSLIHIETPAGPVPSLCLAPMAVLPERQNQGIGSQLIREGLRRAGDMGFPSVTVLGHPAYYPRFGFRTGSTFGLRPPFEVPDEAFMALELVEGSLKNVEGVILYPEIFLEA